MTVNANILRCAAVKSFCDRPSATRDDHEHYGNTTPPLGCFECAAANNTRAQFVRGVVGSSTRHLMTMTVHVVCGRYKVPA